MLAWGRPRARRVIDVLSRSSRRDRPGSATPGVLPESLPASRGNRRPRRGPSGAIPPGARSVASSRQARRDRPNARGRRGGPGPRRRSPSGRVRADSSAPSSAWGQRVGSDRTCLTQIMLRPGQESDTKIRPIRKNLAGRAVGTARHERTPSRARRSGGRRPGPRRPRRA